MSPKLLKSFSATFLNILRMIFPERVLGKPVTNCILLELTKGNIITSNSYLLTLKAPAIVIGGSLNSFVSGPLKKIGSAAFLYPIGKSEAYNPISLTISNSLSDSYIAEYFHQGQTLSMNKDTSIKELNSEMYWKCTRVSGSSVPYLTLYWNENNIIFAKPANCKVSAWNNNKWKDNGLTSSSGNALIGSITCPFDVTSSYYTVGRINDTTSVTDQKFLKDVALLGLDSIITKETLVVNGKLVYNKNLPNVNCIDTIFWKSSIGDSIISEYSNAIATLKGKDYFGSINLDGDTIYGGGFYKLNTKEFVKGLTLFGDSTTKYYFKSDSLLNFRKGAAIIFEGVLEENVTWCLNELNIDSLTEIHGVFFANSFTSYKYNSGKIQLFVQHKVNFNNENNFNDYIHIVNKVNLNSLRYSIPINPQIWCAECIFNPGLELGNMPTNFGQINSAIGWGNIRNLNCSAIGGNTPDLMDVTFFPSAYSCTSQTTGVGIPVNFASSVVNVNTINTPNRRYMHMINGESADMSIINSSLTNKKYLLDYYYAFSNCNGPSVSGAQTWISCISLSSNTNFTPSLGGFNYDQSNGLGVWRHAFSCLDLYSLPNPINTYNKLSITGLINQNQPADIFLDDFSLVQLARNAGSDTIVCSGTTGVQIGIPTFCLGSKPDLIVSYSWTSVPNYNFTSGQNTNPYIIVKPTVSTVFRLTTTIQYTDGNQNIVTCSDFDDINVQVSNLSGQITVNQDPCTAIQAQLTVMQTNGIAPYSYLWSNGSVGNMTTVNTNGVYSVTITDATGCSSVVSQNIVITNFQVIPSNALGSCIGQNTGQISITTIGGLSNYSYNWTCGALSGGGTSSQPNWTIFNLPNGNITINISSSSGCSKTISVVLVPSVIVAPIPIINGEISECSPNDLYEVTNVVSGAQYNYIITFSNLTTVTGSGTSVTINSNTYSLSSAGFNVTFIANQGTTCEVSSNLQVYSCCEGGPNLNNNINTNYPTLTFNNMSASQLLLISDLNGYVSQLNGPNNSPYVVLTSKSASAQNIEKFAINGTFSVDQNMVISFAEILMGPNAKFVLQPNVALIIQDDVYMHDCGYMWDGIYLTNSSPSSFMYSQQLLYIEGSKNGVVVSRENEVHLEKTTFNQNLCAIQILNSSNNGSTFTGCKFESVSNLFTAPFTTNTLINPSPTYSVINTPPISQQQNVRGKGFSVLNCFNTQGGFGLQIGHSSLSLQAPMSSNFGCVTCPPNEFINLDNGIVAKDAQIKIVNNKFVHIDDLISNTIAGSGIVKVGTAVHISGSPSPISNSKIVVGGSNNSVFNLNNLKNYFTNCKNGIYTGPYTEVDISYNQFENIYINAIHNFYPTTNVNMVDFTTKINNNRFLNCNRAIMSYNLFSRSGQLHEIKSNYYFWGNLTIPLAPLNYSPYRQFLSVQNTNNTALNIEVSENYISNAHTAFSFIGVAGNSPNYAKVENNTITLAGYPLGTYAAEYGIRTMVSRNLSFNQNTISGTTPMNVFQRGISNETGQGYIEYKNNNLLHLGAGIRAYNSMVTLGLYCNIMDHDYVGFVNDGSNVGQQGNTSNTNDNQWTNNYYYDEFANGQYFYSNWYLRSFPNSYQPIVLPLNINLSIFKNLVNNINITNCTNPCLSPSQCRLSYYIDKIYAIDTSNFYSLEQKYLVQSSLYEELMAEGIDTIVVQDSLFIAFKDSMSNSNATKLNSIDEVASMISVNTAETINDNITPGNNSESNLKVFNDVYLETWARENYELTPAQIEILTSIAIQNPVEGGVAVYLARILLDIFIDDELPESQARLLSINSESKKLKLLNCKLIQNPIENDIRINCTDDIKSVNSVNLYNSLGQLVASWHNLFANNGLLELSVNGLTQGFYNIVLISDNSVYNDKIFIK